MDTQVTTKFKILKPANEVFEAIVDPEKIVIIGFHRELEEWNKARRLLEI